jgi:Ca2+-binding RTX toxin-like protein
MRPTARRIPVILILALTAGMLVVVGATPALAAPVTTTFSSGDGVFGGQDRHTEFSVDDITYVPAFVIANHPAWAKIPGTEYTAGAADWASNAPATNTFFRSFFVLPPGVTGASLQVCVHADDASETRLNGTLILSQVGFSDPAECATSANLVTGVNTLKFTHTNTGGPGGLNFEAQLTFDGCTSTGTTGDDNLVGTDGADVLCGLGGNDSFSGLRGNDVLIGGPGNDFLAGGRGDDVLDGGMGADSVTVQDSGVTGVVNVNLVTGSSTNTILGSDTLVPVTVENVVGSPGADTITGNAFDNFVNGKAGDDTATGGDGADTLVGGAGGDSLSGQAGNDAIQPGTGNDPLVDGGAGTGDTLKYNDITGNLLTVDLLLNGMAPGSSDAGNDAISGFENVTGSAGNDSLLGDLGATVSVLNGIGGDDDLWVNDSSPGDVANGGPGTDTCTGDAGDTLVSC